MTTVGCLVVGVIVLIVLYGVGLLILAHGEPKKPEEGEKT